MFNIQTSDDYEKLLQMSSFNHVVNKFGVGEERQTRPIMFQPDEQAGSNLDAVSEFYKQYRNGKRDI